MPTGIRQLPGRHVLKAFNDLVQSINEHLSILCRELQCQLFSWVSQKRVWYVLFRAVPLNLMARSCELVTTVASCILLGLALPMLSLYWAASAAPWLWRSYAGFILTADSRVSSWCIFKQRMHTVYLLPSAALVTLRIWHRTWMGEHRHGMHRIISFPVLCHNWENSSKQESPDSGSWALLHMLFQ